MGFAPQGRIHPLGGPEAPVAPSTGILDMPEEILRRFANLLPPEDRIAWAAGHLEEIYPAIRSETQAAILTTEAVPRVKTLAEFQALLDSDSFQALPSSLQGEPLAALGARITKLPWSEQKPAIDVFLAVAQNRTGPLLNELKRAAADGEEGLRARAEAACTGPGRAAVERAENVRVVAQRLGIPAGSNQFIKLESFSAHGPGLDAVRRGEGAADVIQRLGVSHPDLIYGLEQAVGTEGGKRALVRRPPDAVLSDTEIWSLYRNVYAGEDGLPLRRRARSTI